MAKVCRILFFFLLIQGFLFSEDPLKLGEEAYLLGDFSGAEEYYAQVGQELRSAEYFQNLSLIYFWEEKYPLSLYAAHQSLAQNPWNPPLLEQMVEIRSRLDLKGEPPQKHWTERVFFWYSLMRPFWWYLMIIICWNILWVSLFLNKRGFSLPRFLSFLMLAMISFSLLSLSVYRYKKKHPIEVLLQDQMLFQERGTFQELLDKDPFPAGTEFRLLENRGHWQEVELGENRQGWIEIKE